MKPRNRKYQKTTAHSRINRKRAILESEQKRSVAIIDSVKLATQFVMSAMQIQAEKSKQSPNYQSGGIVIHEDAFIDKEVFDKLKSKPTQQ